MLFALAVLPNSAKSNSIERAFSFQSGSYTYYTDYLDIALVKANSGSTILVRNSTGYLFGYEDYNTSYTPDYYYYSSGGTSYTAYYNGNYVSNGYVDNKSLTIESSNGTQTISRYPGFEFYCIYLKNTASLTIKNVIFDGKNIATGYPIIGFDENAGAGNKSINIYNCTFKNCNRTGKTICGNGGAISMYNPSNGTGSLYCENVVFENNKFMVPNFDYYIGNKTVFGGGAVAVQNRVNANFVSCEFYKNESADAGGAIFLFGAGNVTINNCTIGAFNAGNKACIAGGGVYATLVSNKEFSIINRTKIQYNRLDQRSGGPKELGNGGGIYIIGSNATNTNFIIGDENGGNMYESEAAMVQISNNYARGGGGGITLWCDRTATTVKMQNFLIENNEGDDISTPYYWSTPENSSL